MERDVADNRAALKAAGQREHAVLTVDGDVPRQRDALQPQWREIVGYLYEAPVVGGASARLKRPDLLRGNSVCHVNLFYLSVCKYNTFSLTNKLSNLYDCISFEK